MMNGTYCTREIIYISSIPWEFSWHRQQEMMTYMAKYGFRVLFVEPCSKRYPFQKMFVQERENIWRIRPCGLPYERCLKTVNHLNAVLSRTDIQKVARQIGFQKPMIWLDRVHGFDLKCLRKEYFVVYDLIDEILAFGRIRNDKLLLDLENQVLRRADFLLSSSQTLMNRKIQQSGRNGKALFLPNGVNCSRFQSVEPRIHQDVKEHLTIGFVGHISKRSINFQLVQSVAKLKPEWTLLFVGPGTQEDKSALKNGIANIETRAPVDGSEVPNVIQEFDVGMIPYNVEDEKMDYVFPRKACEYLASGRPVVSTRLKEVEALAPYVAVADTPEAFIRQIENSLNGEVTAKQRREFCSRFDWDCLMGKFMAQIPVKEKK